tara:strand:+ start:876 stop:1061 length:186 start_codon:yes stop_codon:yes gene_type:complete
MKKFAIIIGAIILLALIGEIKCIVKAASCNWSPIGKAEVIYTASAFTGFGAIVGWVNIEDK